MPTAEETVIVNPDRFLAALLRKPTIALSCRPARYTKPLANITARYHHGWREREIGERHGVCVLQAGRKPPRPLICEACLYGNHDNCSNCGCCCEEVRHQQIMATVRGFFQNQFAMET